MHSTHSHQQGSALVHSNSSPAASHTAQPSSGTTDDKHHHSSSNPHAANTHVTANEAVGTTELPAADVSDSTAGTQQHMPHSEREDTRVRSQSTNSSLWDTVRPLAAKAAPALAALALLVWLFRKGTSKKRAQQPVVQEEAVEPPATLATYVSDFQLRPEANPPASPRPLLQGIQCVVSEHVSVQVRLPWQLQSAHLMF